MCIMCVYTHAHTHAYLLKSVSSYLIRNSSDISKKNKAIVPTISALISTLMQILVKVIDHEKWLRGIRIDKTDKEAVKLSFFFFAADLNVYLENSKESKESINGASLVAQWLRIHLPMQGTCVRALVQEDPTCCQATKPVRHNYWACAREPVSHTTEPTCYNYWSPHT